MPLDHYVSQVHLKNFYAPSLNGLMYAIRKTDLKRFRTKAQDVCRMEEGSTNVYLVSDRAIEEFLKEVEPRYNASVTKLRENKIDRECVYCIAGFAAYVLTCSPAAMRIHSEPLKAILGSTVSLLDQQGLIPKAPQQLGGKSITELLSDGTVHLKVDPKYPQAIGISNVLQHVSIFGNSHWDILINKEPRSPFFSSDFPVAIEAEGINIPISRIVPLAPDLAIRIKPDMSLSRAALDLSFARFSASRSNLKSEAIRQINRLIVRCAEDYVFYRDEADWVESFVTKNRYYRVEADTQTISIGTGRWVVATQRIAKTVR